MLKLVSVLDKATFSTEKAINAELAFLRQCVSIFYFVLPVFAIVTSCLCFPQLHLYNEKLK